MMKHALHRPDRCCLWCHVLNLVVDNNLSTAGLLWPHAGRMNQNTWHPRPSLGTTFFETGEADGRVF